MTSVWLGSFEKSVGKDHLHRVLVGIIIINRVWVHGDNLNRVWVGII